MGIKSECCLVIEEIADMEADSDGSNEELKGKEKRIMQLITDIETALSEVEKAICSGKQGEKRTVERVC